MKKLLPIAVLIVFGCIAVFSIFSLSRSRQSRIPQEGISTGQGTRTLTVTPIVPPVASSDVKEQSISLVITAPKNNTTVSSPTITVKGKTVPKADVFVNEKETTADTTGNFSLSYTLEEGENSILVIANDADGNASEAELTIAYTNVQ